MVSVIVPVYNTAKYLSKCIESILNQTYDDLELILVDDGSTDNSYDICKNYAKKDERVVVLQKENGGQGSARNLGLDYVRGEYITFVDSDDYIEENLIEKLLKILIDNFADISCGGVYSKSDKSDFKTDADLLLKNNEEAMKLFVWNKDGFNHSPVSKIFKAEMFQGVRFMELRGFEDAATMYKVFMNARRVVSYNISLYFYLQREESTMHRAFSVRDFDRVLAYKEMETGLRNSGKYQEAAGVVTAAKIGAIYYVMGEAMRSDLPEKNELIEKCREEGRSTLRDGCAISVKNKILLYMLDCSPHLFGFIYGKWH